MKLNENRKKLIKIGYCLRNCGLLAFSLGEQIGITSYGYIRTPKNQIIEVKNA